MAFLLLILLSLFASPSTAYPLLNLCDTGEEYNSNSSTYGSNLNHLVSTLSSKASSADFANYTTGTIPDIIYAFFLCRGDTDSDTCHSCIYQARSDIQKLCPNKKEASIWYDYCQLSYSNRDYLFFPNVTENIQALMYKIENVSADQRFRFENLVTSLIGNMSHLALTDTSQLFATGETALTATDKLYGMVQCLRVLSIIDCQTCLQKSMKEITSDPPKGKRGARVLGLWCFVRFELYKFYNGTSMLQLSFNKPPSTTNGTSNTAHQPANVSSGGRKTMIRRVTIFLPIGILLLICTIIYLIWLKKRRDKGKLQNDQMSLTHGRDLVSKLKIEENGMEFSLIKFSSIMEATNNFSSANKLGQGGFGSVYKGHLPSGESMAVKRLDTFSGQGMEEFMNEIKLIAKLQHQNLVKLLGCCIEENEKLLVYEYMPNNSLDYHLFDLTRKEQLDWSKRFAIIDGIAQGLLYLHKYSRVQIIHRDLKASNILLDLKMNPKISDFGLARIFDASTTPANTNRIVVVTCLLSMQWRAFSQSSLMSLALAS